jgi:FtsP/CotA-like multicopper oxidase with cupredoxin domain
VPGPYASLGEGIPLVVQDRTFVPDAAQLALQDPTWDVGRWGSKGSFWYHHVYMPAQNPGDPSGMSAYGRWMYGSWFWPPASPTYGPIDNPYFDPNCNLDDPATWQYQTDPFCEPAQIPGTPNISVGMEQFNDTPIVNGVAYPTITLEPKTYRLRMLNAANDRFFNFQWYVADPTTGTDSEVALKASELAAAQLDPNVFPTPDTTVSLPGPDWVQIGSEGGFLPAPTVIDGQQVTTWITDPTRFDVGNVDLHSLLLAPAERADVIVDFSQFAGKTLILYNDAPAAFPARVASYDYYTGAPDLSPAGAPTIVPGYGPNTRTIMQVKIAGTPAPAFNVSALAALFTHKADGSGVFEAGQHPTIVGQAAYNTAYGKNFAASSNCNVPGSSLQRCDGFVRINDTAQFSFNTLLNPITAKLTMPLQPKAIHDEMNSTTFDEFGRMQANLGVEAQPPTPGLQNVTLYPSINPATEIIDGTNLPKGDINVTPISNANDGTQIWRITHNGVDTHPIHFHLFDVQVVNRVTWDNIIIPPDANELGWKDTVRISPLEDTIVALRPIVPNVPFELPNSIRLLNPAMPAGDTSIFNNIDPQGNPTNPIINQLVNFGWEYTYHCHILSHEEMDMMRPVSLALPPNRATGLAAIITGSGNNRRFRISWTDNSINETGFVLQRTSNGTTWINVGTSPSPLNQPNTHGTRSLTDASSNVNAAYLYRVVAQNAVGYGAEFPSMTVQSYSDTLGVNPPLAPSTLAATLQAGPVIRLTWKDNSNNETGFTLQRSTDGVNFNTGISLPANTVSYNDTVAAGAANITYTYQVVAVNIAGSSLPSPTASVIVPAMPLAPSNFSAVNGPNNNNSRSVVLTWTDNSNNETGFTIQRATNANFTGNSVTTVNVGANVTSLTVTGLSRNTSYWFRIRANNGTIIFTGYVNATPFPIVTNP